MSELKEINRAIEKFSLIGRDSTPEAYNSVQDILLRCAGLFRQAEKAYEINYRSEGNTVYQLRSDKQFNDSRVERVINFSRLNSKLLLAVEDIDDNLLKAIEHELQLLIKKVNDEDFNSTIEPELNLLRSSAFVAELEVEFQRWERYQQPFLFVVCTVQAKDINWKEPAREIKHQAKMTDIIGYLSEQRVGAIFPGREVDSSLRSRLNNRINERFEKELKLKLIHVPDDCKRWDKLKDQAIS